MITKEFIANGGTYSIHNVPKEKDVTELISMIKELTIQDIESFPVGSEFDYSNLVELFELE